MSGVIFVGPYTPPGAPRPEFIGVELLWIGWDGSEWDLTGSDIVQALPGIRGLDDPPPTKRFSSSATTIAGSRRRGMQVLEKPFYLPVRVSSEQGSQSFLEYARAFLDTMDEDRPGTLVVTRPDASKRSLVLRFDSLDADGTDIDPVLVGMREYGFNLVAEQPYWTGDAVTRRFEVAEPAPFIPEGGGPPFTISESSTVDTASMPNPGNVTAWPTWWAGSFESIVLGVGDLSIEVPFEVSTDRWLILDASPTARTAKEIDAPPPSDKTGDALEAEQEAWVASQLPTALDRTLELGDVVQWAAVPAGQNVQLTVNPEGTEAWIRVQIVPRYKRAL